MHYAPYGLGFSVAALVLQVGVLALALALLRALILAHFPVGPRQASRVVWLYALFPTNLFLQLHLAEGMLLVCATGAFWALRTRRWVWLALFAGCLPVVKVAGVLLGFALALGIVHQETGWLQGRWRWADLLRFWPLLTMLAAFGTYMAYMRARTGDSFAYLTAQERGWYHEWKLPWRALFAGGDAMEQHHSVFWIIMALVALAGAKKWLPSWRLATALQLLFPLLAGAVHSIPRYSSAIFPLFVQLGLWLSRLRQGAWWAVMVACAVGQGLYFYLWLSGHKIMM